MKRNYSWPLFVVGAVLLTAFALIGQGRLWSQPAAGDEELSLASSYAVFTLEASGTGPLGNFISCSGLGMSNEIDYGYTTLPPGLPAMQSSPGALEAHEITLRSEEPGNFALWQWRKIMDSGGFNAALREGSITMYDSRYPEPVATWVFHKGWPAKVMFQDGKLEVVIAHAGVEMVAPGGGGAAGMKGRTK